MTSTRLGLNLKVRETAALLLYVLIHGDKMRFPNFCITVFFYLSKCLSVVKPRILRTADCLKSGHLKYQYESEIARTYL